MVKCPKCGAEVRYIPSKGNTLITDAEPKEVITATGRVVMGYTRHKCPEKGKRQGEHD
jgi:predicted RNA-binding Zn-ribbon protein involved in translation (DUF1610 family)